MSGESRRLAVYCPSFSDGGVERNMVLLANGFADAGVPTDLLVGGEGPLPFLERLSPKVGLIRLPQSRRARRAATVAYLRASRPASLMSAKESDDRLALEARRIARVDTRVFLRCGTHLSARPGMSTRNPLRRWWHHRRQRQVFAAADGVVCVSEGVAQDLVRVSGIARERIRVIRNPAVTPDLERLAGAPVDHPWFQPGQAPVVLAAGRLAAVKRFDDLVRAFALLLGDFAARLVILGEGKERPGLEQLVARLGIADRVDLPGYVANPLAFMRRAALFVLSSEREGAPNVLTEALACGTAVVATDCPSGPREILAGGRYGPLVPVGDVDALRRAMLAVLRDPPRQELLREAVAEHTLPRAVANYLAAFGLR
jgi:glycosyltransferase involved in cell wall biosynthesis